MGNFLGPLAPKIAKTSKPKIEPARSWSGMSSSKASSFVPSITSSKSLTLMPTNFEPAHQDRETSPNLLRLCQSSKCEFDTDHLSRDVRAEHFVRRGVGIGLARCASQSSECDAPKGTCVQVVGQLQWMDFGSPLFPRHQSLDKPLNLSAIACTNSLRFMAITFALQDCQSK
ncbi:MAG: hypothetical protein YYHSYBAR_000681 [Candidatus Fervidibacter sacchari]